MAVKLHVEGFDAFIKAVEDAKKDHAGKTLYVLFSGKKDAEGNSWCPDCVKAEPVVEAAMAKATNAVYLHVDVGERPFWKDPKCIFRTDERTRLKGIPTLIKWGTVQRLEDGCSDPDLLSLMFEDDD